MAYIRIAQRAARLGMSMMGHPAHHMAALIYGSPAYYGYPRITIDAQDPSVQSTNLEFWPSPLNLVCC